MLDFLVARDDLRSCRVVESETPAPAPGQALLRVDRFAFTANNVTYALAGDLLGYWRYFPAPDGWGRVPVWGFAEVIASRHDAATVGDRVFGYLPMSTHLLVQPQAAGSRAFDDAAPHRAGLPAIYNRYRRLALEGDGAERDRREAERALLHPLFITGFILDDFLADNGFFGARAAVISSASSKTAIGTAQLLAARKQVAVVGLTAPERAAFVEGLGCYDRVVPYDQLDQLPVDAPAVYLDFAGDAAVTRQVHERLADRLASSLRIGRTHASAPAGDDGSLPGPRPVMFFAPSQVDKRVRDWGGDGLQARMAAARQTLAGQLGWLRIVESRGREAVERVYREVLDGRVRPDEGHVVSLI